MSASFRDCLVILQTRGSELSAGMPFEQNRGVIKDKVHGCVLLEMALEDFLLQEKHAGGQ